MKARKRRTKNQMKILKTSQTCGEIDVSNSKSQFYHTPNAQARNCGKMHVSDPFFIKRTWIFCCYKMKNAHILLQITLFCSISLWNDLSVRVVTYDWTVVFTCSKASKEQANPWQLWVSTSYKIDPNPATTLTVNVVVNSHESPQRYIIYSSTF